MSSDNRVRVLILGTGNMASSHARLFAADPRVTVAGCCDVDAGRAKAFAEKHGIPTWFEGLAPALAWGQFDAASNVTPDAVHHPTTMKLLEAGKHVLCEKPLAENFAKADEMARAALKAGVVNMVNLSYRNVPALEKAQAMIAAGDIGEVRHVEASYRQSWLVGRHWGDWRTESTWLWRLSEAHGSRGVLGDVGIHILDFATYAVGMMPVSLQAQLKTFDKAVGNRIGDYGLDANDSAAMQVTFGNGALGLIHASRFMTGYGNTLKLSIFGTAGAIEIDHGSEWTEIRACLGEDVHTLAWRKVKADAVPSLHQRFIDAIVGNRPAQPDFRRGAELQAVLDLCFSPAAAKAVTVKT